MKQYYHKLYVLGHNKFMFKVKKQPNLGLKIDMTTINFNINSTVMAYAFHIHSFIRSFSDSLQLARGVKCIGTVYLMASQRFS